MYYIRYAFDLRVKTLANDNFLNRLDTIFATVNQNNIFSSKYVLLVRLYKMKFILFFTRATLPYNH